jgi:chemotaxis protein methyltransferase CheR
MNNPGRVAESNVAGFTGSLTLEDFRRLSGLIHESCGIKLPEVKRSMLEARLSKRLKALRMPSFRAYCDFLFSTDGMQNELLRMIDVVTTNKTDFFRESHHFTYLVNTALPGLLHQGVGKMRALAAWSAGCSTGEEVYTLSMVLTEFAAVNQGYRFSILGTDISETVLQKARAGIYDSEKVEPIPQNLKKKYLLRSKTSDLVKIGPELRRAVRFGRLNLMDRDYAMAERLHVIFCRNVIIYFDAQTQLALLKKLCANLADGGYLFMGHSEMLDTAALPLTQCAPTVYRKTR